MSLHTFNPLPIRWMSPTSDLRALSVLEPDIRSLRPVGNDFSPPQIKAGNAHLFNASQPLRINRLFAPHALADQPVDSLVVPVDDLQFISYLRRSGITQDCRPQGTLLRYGDYGYCDVTKNFRSGDVHVTQYLRSLKSADRLGPHELETLLGTLGNAYSDADRILVKCFIPGDSGQDIVTFGREQDYLKVVKFNNFGSMQHYKTRRLQRALQGLGFETNHGGFMTIASGAAHTSFLATDKNSAHIILDLVSGNIQPFIYLRGSFNSLQAQLDDASQNMTASQAQTLLEIERIDLCDEDRVIHLVKESQTEIPHKKAMTNLINAYEAYLKNYALDPNVLEAFSLLYDRLVAEMETLIFSKPRFKIVSSEKVSQPKIELEDDSEFSELLKLHHSYRSYTVDGNDPITIALYQDLMDYFWGFLSQY